MKIEKVNDHQIRCTLTKADLADRELKISELAYGTEKAKSLFRDMMQQASQQFGFEAEDIPLMIEAIPLNADCIVLIITKVEDPEELDTRFSRFAPSVHEDDNLDDMIQDLTEGADDVLDLFKRLHGDRSTKKEDKKAAPDKKEQSKDDRPEEPLQMTRTFSFSSMGDVLRLAGVLKDFYQGESFLYKNPETERYILLINNEKHTPDEFNRICNCVSEYGHSEKSIPGGESYWQEHCSLILAENALTILSQL